MAGRVSLTAEQKRPITHGKPVDPCWPSDESVLLRAVDEFHDHADITDATCSELASTLDPEQILDLLMLGRLV